MPKISELGQHTTLTGSEQIPAAVGSYTKRMQLSDVIALASANQVTMSTTQPTAPEEGTLWFDETAGVLKIYNDGQWKNTYTGGGGTGYLDDGEFLGALKVSGLSTNNHSNYFNGPITNVSEGSSVGDVYGLIRVTKTTQSADFGSIPFKDTMLINNYDQDIWLCNISMHQFTNEVNTDVSPYQVGTGWSLEPYRAIHSLAVRLKPKQATVITRPYMSNSFQYITNASNFNLTKWSTTTPPSGPWTNPHPGVPPGVSVVYTESEWHYYPGLLINVYLGGAPLGTIGNTGMHSSWVSNPIQWTHRFHLQTHLDHRAAFASGPSFFVTGDHTMYPYRMQGIAGLQTMVVPIAAVDMAVTS